jgi:hypothetical protein
LHLPPVLQAAVVETVTLPLERTACPLTAAAAFVPSLQTEFTGVPTVLRLFCWQAIPVE